MNTFDEVIEYLYVQLPMFQNKGEKALEYKLDNILTFCSHLKHPQNNYPIIHIAGTNGKGSVAHILASILQEAGLKVGLYTSPHLKSFTERIKVNGDEISEKAVISFVNKNILETEKLKPSFFEWTVAMAFEEFSQQNVDIAVIEVGLGGRLDSTNIVQPILSIITNISYDHTHILGDTLSKIAYEKAGIIKNGVPIVIGEWNEETLTVFQKKALKMNAPLILSDAHSEVYECELKGKYQQKNIQTVLTAINTLNEGMFEISKEHIKNGLSNVIKNTQLKGRWQVLTEIPKMVCDTAHNEAGVSIVVEQLATDNFTQLWIIWGMVKDKDFEKILSLLPKEANYYFCEPNIERKLDASELVSVATKIGLKAKLEKNVNNAISKVKSLASDDDLIYIGGSTFVVAEIDEL